MTLWASSIDFKLSFMKKTKKKSKIKTSDNIKDIFNSEKQSFLV